MRYYRVAVRRRSLLIARLIGLILFVEAVLSLHRRVGNVHKLLVYGGGLCSSLVAIAEAIWGRGLSSVFFLDHLS